MYKLSVILSFIFLSSSLGVLGQQNTLKNAVTATNKPSSKRIIFYLTGDGGMTNFSESLVSELREDYAVVCIDSKKYFWEQKSLEGMTSDITQSIRHYLKFWDKVFSL